MIGEYKIDESKLFDILKSRLDFLLKKILPLLILFFLFGIMFREKLMILIFGVMSFLIVSIYFLTPFFYKSKNDPLSKLSIIIGENELYRTGEGLLKTKISFDEIGDIKERNNGIHVLRKGFFNQVMFFYYIDSRDSDSNIIWIPNEIEQYAEIKDFLFDKFYSLQFKNKGT